MKKWIKISFGILGALVLINLCFGPGLKPIADHQIQQVEDQVAADAIKQYEIAARQGDRMQIYVQASLVSAAFLQAKDEGNYDKWKTIERKAAKAAGMMQ